MKRAKLSSKDSTNLSVFKLHPLGQAIREAIRSRHPHKQWVGGVVAATLIGLASPALGQSLELSDLDGTNGFKIFGESNRDSSGESVSGAGDINSDGIADVIIGAFRAGSDSGASYVVFGNDQGFSTPVELSSVDGSNGFKLNGEAAGDRSGFSVSAAGDVNGDGIDDLIIGALFANPNGVQSGASYVVFGSDQGFNTPIDLSGLNGTTGFKLNGETARDESGVSVSGAGDINGDGIDDVIIGANRGGPNRYNSGASYVVFGNDQGFSTPFELSSLDGTNGFKFHGENVRHSVSGAGDVNGDGIDDVIIGEYNDNFQSGASYVVFGSDQGFSTPFELSSLNGRNGFKLNGEADNDFSGRSVSGAGDLNGDGIDDVIIGADGVDTNGTDSGASYVVFGSDKGFSTPIELSDLDGTTGFKINGEARYDHSGGVSVSGAGDVNGDGIDDLIIGAHLADPNGDYSGTSYVVFGSDQGFITPLELSSLDGTTGFKLNGERAIDFSGESVSAAGDVNGDGIEDVIIGAARSDSNGFNTGTSYVVYGSPISDQVSALPILAALGDINSNGSEDIAVLVHDATAGTVTATVKDANDGSFIQQISFSGSLKPVDFEVMADINANGAPEVVVLGQGQGSVQAEVRDSLTGALLGSVDFDPDVKPIDLEIVPDQDGNGIPELAVLGESPAQVGTRDALTGNLVKKVSFTDNITPKDLVVLPDLNGKGGPDIGVLGEDENPNEADRVEIRDLLTGKWVHKLTYGKYIVHQARVVPDLNNNGTPEIAVLRISNNGKVNVLIKDAHTRALVQGIGYDKNYAPEELLIVPDINSNGASEITVFGKNPNTGAQKAQVKDGKTKARIRNVHFDRTVIPDDMAVIPDINGNGASEIGLLGTRENGKLLRLIIKDGKTGEHVGAVIF